MSPRILVVISLLYGTAGQLNPRFIRKQDDLLQSGLPRSCPNDHPKAFVDLPSPLPGALQKALDDVMEALTLTVNSSFPALSGKPQAAGLQVDYRGEKLAAAFVGKQDPKTQSGEIHEDTIFRIGSVSKIFAVLMLYQLFDRGVVTSLDDPLSKYAPDFELPNVYSRSKRKFTLRQLASQLSGMQRELPCDFLRCNFNTSEILARLKTTPGAQFPEYTEPSYSNAAYALLGNVLADYVNVTYADYVREHILLPLGMTNTGFTFTEDVEKRMAKPYSNVTFIPNTDIGYIAPAGQMYSTIRDLMLLGRYFTGISGDLFDDGLRRELLMPGFLWRDGSFLQGSPWEAQKLDGNWVMLGKGGNVMGFSAVFGTIPSLNLTISAVWSGIIDETTFVATAFEQILPAFLPILETQRPAPTMPDKPSLYIGNYSGVAWVSPQPITFEVYEQTVGTGRGLAAKQMGFPAGFLNFHGNSAAALEIYGDSPTGCFGVMANAGAGLWMTFDIDESGEVQSLELPGELYGVKFMKKKEATSQPDALVV